MNAKVDLKAAVEEEINDVKEEKTVVDQDWTDEQAGEAEAMGWIPPERAGKLPEGKNYIGPVEFMERNPLYSKMKQLESSFSQLNTHYQNVSEIEHKKAEKEFEQRISQLKEEKVQALDDADHKRVVEIDEEIRTTEKPVEASGEDPLFIQWKEKNDWYEKDRFLQVEADDIGGRLISKDLYGVKLFDAVKDHLKQKYPDKFSNPNRGKPSDVEGGTHRQVKKSKTVTETELTADERTIFNNFDRMGVFSVEGSRQKYLDEVIALRD